MITVHRLNDSWSQRAPVSAAAQRIAGTEFTAADVQMSFPLEAAASPAGLDASCPRLTVFRRRIRARAAHQRAPERGGAYSF
jgi:glutathione S-transferase